jgi:hypothetical protein
MLMLSSPSTTAPIVMVVEAKKNDFEQKRNGAEKSVVTVNFSLLGAGTLDVARDLHLDGCRME